MLIMGWQQRRRAYDGGRTVIVAVLTLAVVPLAPAAATNGIGLPWVRAETPCLPQDPAAVEASPRPGAD